MNLNSQGRLGRIAAVGIVAGVMALAGCGTATVGEAEAAAQDPTPAGVEVGQAGVRADSERIDFDLCAAVDRARASQLVGARARRVVSGPVDECAIRWGETSEVTFTLKAGPAPMATADSEWVAGLTGAVYADGTRTLSVPWHGSVLTVSAMGIDPIERPAARDLTVALTRSVLNV